MGLQTYRIIFWGNSPYSIKIFRMWKRIIRIMTNSDRMSYIILRGRWCHIIVLNVHAPTEDKTNDVKDSFYEELELLFDKCPKYHTKILLGISMPK
jgi:hypothetical protein